MMFFILFNYTLVRDAKDSFLASAPNSSSEIFNYIKLAVVMPSALIFVLCYSKLANILSRARLFNFLVGSFLCFFALFGFVIYPNIEILTPSSQVIACMQSSYPNFFYYPLAMYGNWPLVIFYTMAELWGSAMVSLLFWQLANEITRSSEAKRFYSLFGLIANFSLILSGWVVRSFSGLNTRAEEILTTKYLMVFFIVSGFVVLFVNVWLEKKCFNRPFLL